LNTLKANHENTKPKTRSAGAPAAPALARCVRRVSTKFYYFFLFLVFVLSCFRNELIFFAQVRAISGF
jgi:hypothetical protein